MIETVTKSLAVLTVIGDLMIVGAIILFLAHKLFKLPYWEQVASRFTLHAYLFSFIVSTIATLGSLFFSEIAHYTPCLLCWYQRIFMYPQPLLAYLAVVRNERVITPYLLLLNAIGALIAAYHYLIQRLPSYSFLPCEAGGQASCTKDYILHFGYITIPMMALTAFLLNILFLLMSKAYVKNSVSPTQRPHRSRKAN